MRQRKSMETEVRSLIKDMFESDQGEEETAHQVVRLFQRYHDEWYNEVRIAGQDADRLRRELEKYMKRVKILMDGYDKIMEGHPQPVTIATEAVTEAICVRL